MGAAEHVRQIPEWWPPAPFRDLLIWFFSGVEHSAP
jgi:hypothetical protein